MRARLTGITGLAGSPVDFLSEQDRGSGADLDSGQVLVLGLGLDDPDSADARDLVVAQDSADVDRLAVDSAAVCHAEVAFTGAAVDSTVVAVTAAAVRTVEDTAADTGNF